MLSNRYRKKSMNGDFVLFERIRKITCRPRANLLGQWSTTAGIYCLVRAPF
ncbi:hypothetical protein PEV8663_04735 [Pelagimonas varians]|uniref:Uncharacterized protein n=1 Tax=Pelagimonas varians TaxID=696760 RepID=A0A238L6K3_9RHOB|nr:hypothetical protein PEV8663_04735 [Pelagimonas varians]